MPNTGANLQVIGNLFNVVTEMAKFREQKYRSLFYTLPNKSGLHTVNNLDLTGNLGRLTFVCNDGKMVGANWLAPSSRIKSSAKKLAAYRFPEDIIIYRSRSGQLIEFSNQQQSTNLLTPLFSATCSHSKRDSEYVLLNKLAISAQRELAIGGVLYLVTERIPCHSCTTVLRKLLDSHKNIKNVYLTYMYDLDENEQNKERSHIDFLNDVSGYPVHLLLSELSTDTLNILRLTTSSKILKIHPRLFDENRQRFSPPGFISTRDNEPSPHFNARIQSS